MRESAWAPRYVGNELAGTRQLAEQHRQTAALRAAEAAATDTDIERARLRDESTQAEALAIALDHRVAELETLDSARSRWLTHTAGTRAVGERATTELAIRHADAEPDTQVTANEWLQAHHAAMTDDDASREVREDYEFDGIAREWDLATAPQDLREIAAGDGPVTDQDVVRVPTADETADALTRAHRALDEITAREVYEDTEARAHTDLDADHDEDVTADETLDYV